MRLAMASLGKSIDHGDIASREEPEGGPKVEAQLADVASIDGLDASGAPSGYCQAAADPCAPVPEFRARPRCIRSTRRSRLRAEPREPADATQGVVVIRSWVRGNQKMTGVWPARKKSARRGNLRMEDPGASRQTRPSLLVRIRDPEDSASW